MHDDRLEAHDNLRERGVEPYPRDIDPPTTTLCEFNERFGDHPSIEDVTENTRLGGRVIRINDLGGIAFVELRDETGQCQLLLREDTTRGFDLLTDIGLGDHVLATGTPTRSNTGELSLDVEEWEVATKALRHPPWASHDAGFDNRNLVEQRAAALQLRNLHESVRLRFEVAAEIRRQLEGRGFLEVSTPILHPMSGGAQATPFETHSEAFDADLSMRIAPELYLKRLLVGDFDRIFEVGKNFRNEDIDSTHNPEFQMLEVYEAYADYRDMMQLTEELVSTIAERVTGDTTVTVDGTAVDLSPPWERVEFEEVIALHGSGDPRDMTDDELRDAAARHGDIAPNAERSECLMELYDAVAEPAIDGPAFVLHHPADSTPLCQPLPGDDTRLQRFEAVIGGVELANAYTELRDPIEQGRAFRRQAERTGGEVDEAFVDALAYGMPPAAGLGIGIDRLAMMLADTDSIKAVLPFPQTSPD